MASCGPGAAEESSCLGKLLDGPVIADDDRAGVDRDQSSALERVEGERHRLSARADDVGQLAVGEARFDAIP
jgi:hypothetical protein